MTVTITGPVEDVTGIADNSSWQFASVLRFTEDGTLVTAKPKVVYPVAGILTVKLAPGPAIVTYGKQAWNVTVPDTDGTLRALIEAGIAFPPETAQAALDAAVAQSIIDHADELTVDSVEREGDALLFKRGGDTLGSPVDISDLTFSGTIDGVSDAAAAGIAVVRSETEGDAREAINAHPLLPEGYFSAAGKADGALTVLDSGQSWSVFGNTPGVIVDGEVVHTPAGPGASTAAYYQVATTSRPTRITCKGHWTAADGNDNSSLTIAVPISAWGPDGGFPAGTPAQVVAGIHSSFYRNGIHKHSRWNVGDQTVYGDSEAAAGSNPALGRYAPVAVGESVWFEMWIDYDSGTLTFFPPGGGAPYVVQDDAISDDCGNFVVWEQFEYLGTTAGSPFVIEEMHFDTQVRQRNSLAMTKLDLAEAFVALASNAQKVDTIATTGGTTTLTAASGRVIVFTGTSAQTLVLPTTDIAAGEFFWVQNATTNVISVQSSNGNAVGALSASVGGVFFSIVPSPTTAGNWITKLLATVNGVETLTGKTLVDPKVRQTVNAQTGTTYTLVATDVNKVVTLNNASPVTVTVPSEATAYMNNGVSIDLAQLGAGQVTVSPAGGVTIHSTPGAKIAAQYGRAKLTKLGTNEWLLSGDLAA